MRIVPTIKIIKNAEELEVALKNFVVKDIQTLRFVITQHTLDEHLDFICLARCLYKKLSGKNFELMLDIPCPKDKLRFEFTESFDTVSLLQGEQIYITNQRDFSKIENGKVFYVNDKFIDKVQEIATIGDGDLLIQITDISDNFLTAICLNSATIKKGKAIASPCGFLKITDSEITNKTLDIIKSLQPEICVLSYIENENDTLEFKKKIEQYANYVPHIMSKIECQKAVDNVEKIIDCSDSIMIARGCLAVNVGIEKLMKIQDDVLSVCQKKGIDVCIASSIMRSIGTSNSPTRADVCDVSHMVSKGMDYFVITDGFCMNDRFNKLIYYLLKIHDIYTDV